MYTRLYNFISKDMNYNLDNIKEISTLSGLNNFCYRVKYLNTSYFIRLYANTPKNLNNEKYIIELCNENNLAPRLYYFSTTTGNMITEWINGVHPSEDEFSSHCFIHRLVDKLLLLHSLNTVNYFNPFDEIRNNIEICRNLNLQLPEYIDVLINILDSIELFCLDNLDYGLCHNDLNPFNIIISQNTLYFIDYEFSGMGDIFYDLASLTWMMSLDGKNYLLKTYFKNLNEYHYKKLYYYTFVIKFLNATWSLIKSENSTCNYDYKKGSQIIFEELLYYKDII